MYDVLLYVHDVLHMIVYSLICHYNDTATDRKWKDINYFFFVMAENPTISNSVQFNPLNDLWNNFNF